MEFVVLNLFGKRAFVDAIKDFKMRRLLSVMQMGPKWHHKCSYMTRQKAATQTHRRETEEKMEQREMQPRAKECPQLPEAGRGKGWILP